MSSMCTTTWPSLFVEYSSITNSYYSVNHYLHYSMEADKDQTKDSENKVEKVVSSKWIETLGQLAESESKKLEEAAPTPPKCEPFTDADGKMRDLVISLGRVRFVVAL